MGRLGQKMRQYERHGLSYTTEYRIWAVMNHRCHNPNYDHYEYYGGRGIRVCKRWRTSFLNFYKDMGPRPKNLTLDRIDNDGNYEPGNVRWATRLEQGANTRKAVLLTFNGETHPIREWARRIGVEHCCITARLKKGWTLQQVLGTKWGHVRRIPFGGPMT